MNSWEMYRPFYLYNKGKRYIARFVRDDLGMVPIALEITDGFDWMVRGSDTILIEWLRYLDLNDETDQVMMKSLIKKARRSGYVTHRLRDRKLLSDQIYHRFSNPSA